MTADAHRSYRASAPLLLALSVVGGAAPGCRAGQPSAGPPLTAPAAPPPSPPPMGSAPMSAAPPAPSGATDSDPTRFRCHDQICRVGTESCCYFSDTGVCVPSVAPGPNDAVQLLASQLEICEATPHRYALTELIRCDESSDCADHEACCGTFLFGGADAQVCVPITTPGRSPCQFQEVCRTDATCRAAGSRCLDGRCRKPAELRCGGQRCTGAASACCGDPPSCQAPAVCEQLPWYHCMSPRDCLPGESCQLNVSGSRCLNEPDIANSRLVCDTASDCEVLKHFCAQLRCEPTDVPGIRGCTC